MDKINTIIDKCTENQGQIQYWANFITRKRRRRKEKEEEKDAI
jgi:hypothetical protein